jgi:hypothetical protein
MAVVLLSADGNPGVEVSVSVPGDVTPLNPQVPLALFAVLTAVVHPVRPANWPLFTMSLCARTD